MKEEAVRKRRGRRRSQPQFIVDEKGSRIGVLIKIAEYKRMLDVEEELASIRAYDEAKASGERPVPFEEASERLERNG